MMSPGQRPGVAGRGKFVFTKFSPDLRHTAPQTLNDPVKGHLKAERKQELLMLPWSHTDVKLVSEVGS